MSIRSRVLIEQKLREMAERNEVHFRENRGMTVDEATTYLEDTFSEWLAAKIVDEFNEEVGP